MYVKEKFYYYIQCHGYKKIFKTAVNMNYSLIDNTLVINKEFNNCSHKACTYFYHFISPTILHSLITFAIGIFCSTRGKSRITIYQIKLEIWKYRIFNRYIHIYIYCKDVYNFERTELKSLTLFFKNFRYSKIIMLFHTHFVV